MGCKLKTRFSFFIINVISVVAFCCLGIILLTRKIDTKKNGESLPREIRIGGTAEVNFSKYIPAGVEANEDFPVNDENTYRNNNRIPKIIHQTWSTSAIRSVLVDNVLSFTKFNPDYEYYFWTDKGGRDLIAEKHKYLLQSFDEYKEPTRKSDMLRYVVLYEYGGIYADLDTVCLRNLDRVLNKYSCVFTPEPFEHATIFYNTDFMVTNSIMFCAAKHPFMKELMYRLPSYSHFAVDIDSTGPLLQTYLLTIYLRVLYARNLTMEHEEGIYVPSDVYFQSEVDIKRINEFRIYCNNFDSLNNHGKKGCAVFMIRGLINRRQNPYTFTKHTFSHIARSKLPPETIEIDKVVPYVKVF